MQDFEKLFLKGTLLIQEYITNPFLIDGLKFDLRLYVLITSADPLKIFLYKDGLVRLSSEAYEAPTQKNMKNMFKHLTNYAINKESKTFIQNEEIGEQDKSHKRSFAAFWKQLKKQGYDTDQIWHNIKDIILKAFCSGQPFLAHEYKSALPKEHTKALCFEVLGYIIISLVLLIII